MTRLLDAIDALTKPDVLARYVGTDHDHQWLDLVEATTKEERAAAKKAGTKLGRTKPTGQSWCPFCEVVVDEIPDEEPAARINRYDDAPLLDQLEARILSTLSDGGSPGAGGSSVLVDTSAHTLAHRIRRTITQWGESIGATIGPSISLAQALKSWHLLYIAGHAPVGDDDVRANTLTGYVTDIRDLLDPPDQIPYRGQECPICGESRALKIMDGESLSVVAMWAIIRPIYRDEGSYGICRACDTVLGRNYNASEPDIRKQIGGTTRLTHTVAEAAEIA